MANTNMSTQTSVIYHEIQKIIGKLYHGLPMLHLPSLKSLYQVEFERPFNCEFLGVKDIEELLDVMHKNGMVLFYEKPESKEKYAMSVCQVESIREWSKRNVQQLLDEHRGEIEASFLEEMYKNKFMCKLDYHCCCLKDFDHLCEVLNLVVDGAMLRVGVKKKSEIYNIRKRSARSTNMSTQSKTVYQEIQEVIGSYSWGMQVSSLGCLGRAYLQQFNRTLDYGILGVTSTGQLLDRMHKEGKVLFLPEGRTKYVMCAHTVKTRQKVLKRDVQKLLAEHHGEIPLMAFESLYKRIFKVKLDYHFFGLKDLDSLCNVFDLVVDGANFGMEVIKEGKIYSPIIKRK